jgi:hypothetical protein
VPRQGQIKDGSSVDVGHARQEDDEEDPTSAVKYVPVPQPVQTADPVDVLNFPATHAVHIPPSDPECPAVQVQFVKDELPADELEFDGQAMHVEAFTTGEYVPAPHTVHKLASGPVK